MGLASREACRRLEARGLDWGAIGRRAGLPASWPKGTSYRIPVRVQNAFLEQAAAALDDPLFGMHLGIDLDLQDGAVLYYVCSTARDTRSVLKTLERYARIGNEAIRIRVSDEPEGLAVSLRMVPPHDLSGPFGLFCVTIIVKLLRDITGRQIRPVTVALSQSSTAGAKELRAFFGCPVSFRAPDTRVLLPKDVAAHAVLDADHRLYGLLMDYADRLMSELPEDKRSLVSEVEAAIIRRLPDSSCTAAAVARDLGLSARTLSRRLAADGLRFSDVVDHARRDLARHYLGDPRLSIQQIAFLLGYSEPSAFAHAFRRWTGMSPRVARRAS